MSEEIDALRKLHAKMPHCLDWQMEDGFTVPVLNVLIALADCQPKRESGWQPINTAPRNEDIMVAWECEARGWTVKEAWWTSPYEGAPPIRCSWRFHGDKTLLDKSIHGLGAAYWMPKPKPPTNEIDGSKS